MPKLTISQKIIFSILLFASVFAAYDIFLSAPAKKKVGPAAVVGLKPEEIKGLVSTMAIKLSQETVPERYDHLIRQAEKEWPGNPFFSRRQYRDFVLSRDAKTEVKKFAVDYTGYLEAGGRRIAIINDAEYAEGEELEIGGYVLKHISPEKITIENPASRIRQVVPYKYE